MTARDQLKQKSLFVSFMGHGWFVGQSLASKDVSTEAVDIAVIHHQATTGEDTADWEDSVCAVVNCNVGISDSAIVTYSYDLYVFN
jgi:hypothetical protein